MNIIFMILSVLLIICILLQQKSSALGSMMGQDAGDEMVSERRGFEKTLHQITVVLAILFAGFGICFMLFG